MITDKEPPDQTNTNTFKLGFKKYQRKSQLTTNFPPGEYLIQSQSLANEGPFSVWFFGQGGPATKIYQGWIYRSNTAQTSPTHLLSFGNTKKDKYRPGRATVQVESSADSICTVFCKLLRRIDMSPLNKLDENLMDCSDCLVYGLTKGKYRYQVSAINPEGLYNGLYTVSLYRRIKNNRLQYVKDLDISSIVSDGDCSGGLSIGNSRADDGSPGEYVVNGRVDLPTEGRLEFSMGKES